MIVNMSEKATEQEINHVIERIREAGYQPHVTRGTERTIVAAVGSGRRHEIEALQVAPGVDNVVAIAQPFNSSGCDNSSLVAFYFRNPIIATGIGSF